MATLIPPTIFQLSHTPQEQLRATGGLMRTWWEKNPECASRADLEQTTRTVRTATYATPPRARRILSLRRYAYHLFSERDCVSFVRTFGSADDARAYTALLKGEARADSCRAHLLLHLGGVYADVDLELMRPAGSHIWCPPHTVHLPLSALLIPCTVCGTGGHCATCCPPTPRRSTCAN